MTPTLPTTAQQSPPPIPPAARIRLGSPREVIFRVIIAAVVLGSVGLAWWSFAKVLPPLQNKARELSSNLSGLSMEVDGLDGKWPKAAAEQVTNSYDALRSQLFSNEAAFARWLANLNGQASTLTLDAKADFGKTAPVPAPGEKLATIPATIFVEVRPAPGTAATQSPYQRVVQLTQQLCVGAKRTDLAELTVSGGIGSISRAVVVLNLWAGEERAR